MLYLDKFTKEMKLTIIYIFVAYIFSIAARMFWYYHFSSYEPFIFNNQVMINTNDGYLWAEGARDILAGFHQENDLSAINFAPSVLSAFFIKILPFSFETTILFMPAFLSSLIVIPIILIAKSFDNLEMGLIAALLSSIAWSYYNRTMMGYFDTDMLNIVLPLFLLWSIICAIKTNEPKYLLIAALDILIYRWWYPPSYSLEFSFFGLMLLYTLIFDRKNIYNYKLLALMMFAMINIGELAKASSIFVIFYIFKQSRFDRFIYYIFALSIGAFFLSGGFDPIWYELKIYLFKDSMSAQKDGMGLYFYSVMQTIREAGHISFTMFANRISGHVVTFVLSVGGFIYLAYRYKIMLFWLPMIGLGFLALVGGLRFTIYAVVPLAFGVAFLITQAVKILPNARLKILAMTTLTLLILYPNILHIQEYKVPTVFSVDEVKILDELKGIAKREDYVVSWWDFGYPIRYYSDVKTLVDGAKHDGDVNFPVSFILSNPQDVASKMARLDVEYTESGYSLKRENNIKLPSNIERMTKDYGFSDTNDFLLSLQTDIKLPQKTRDIYIYLPYRMLEIYPTVASFSNLDLMSGEMRSKPLFYKSNSFAQRGDIIDLGMGIKFDLSDNSVTISNKKVALKRFVKTVYDKEMKLQKEIDIVNQNAQITLIYMSNYNTFLLLDENTYNSLYIQLMVLQEYDKTIFEEIVLNPHAKVYKLKI